MSTGPRRYRMTIAYVGTAYAGWQSQRRGQTIQGLLEAALEQLVGARVVLTGAGRTDAGVHARGQVGHFDLPRPWPAARLMGALNALLPDDIAVPRLTRTRPGFHARHDAQGKHYRYLLHMGAKASPFQAPFVGRLAGSPPDLLPMRQAAEVLTGKHDFSAFCGSGSAISQRRRHLQKLDVRCQGDILTFSVMGDGFLRHQVRNLVGTLVEVGRGRRTPASMSDLLACRDRRLAGPTAPASGLCLLRVDYARQRPDLT